MSNIEEVANNKLNVDNGNHVIKFSAEWCGPCKMYGPIFDLVLGSKDSVKAHKVDIDTNALLSAQYNVQSVPTTLFINNGEVVKTISGVVSASNLHGYIDQYLDNDPQPI